MQPRKIIALATLKGGSGKSTVAACLGAYWLSAAKSRPVLVDADPQGSLADWHTTGAAQLDGLPLRQDATEKVSALAQELAADYSPVIIDTAGFRNRTTIEAIAASDLTIVPVKPSLLDVKVALQTRRLIEEINGTKERKGRPIAIRFLMTMTTAGSVIARHIRGELERAGFQVLTAEMANRVAYGEATLYGTTPTLRDPTSHAAQEIAAIAHEIEALTF